MVEFNYYHETHPVTKSITLFFSFNNDSLESNFPNTSLGYSSIYAFAHSKHPKFSPCHLSFHYSPNFSRFLLVLSPPFYRYCNSPTIFRSFCFATSALIARVPFCLAFSPPFFCLFFLLGIYWFSFSTLLIYLPTFFCSFSPTTTFLPVFLFP